MIFCNLWPFITTVVGIACWWGGNRQALGRDVRKEWNAQVDKIRPILDSELKDPAPDSKRPAVDDLNRFEHMLRPSARARYREAVERYEQAHDEHTYLPASDFVAITRYEYKSTDHIEAAIRELLGFIPYR